MEIREPSLEDLNAEVITGFLDVLVRDEPTPSGEVYFTTGQVSGATTSMLMQCQEDPKLLRELGLAVKKRFSHLEAAQKETFAANLAPFVRLLEEDFGKLTRNLANQNPEEKEAKAELLDLISNYVSTTKLTSEALHTRLLILDRSMRPEGTFTVIDSADRVRAKIADALKRCQQD